MMQIVLCLPFPWKLWAHHVVKDNAVACLVALPLFGNLTSSLWFGRTQRISEHESLLLLRKSSVFCISVICVPFISPFTLVTISRFSLFIQNRVLLKTWSKTLHTSVIIYYHSFCTFNVYIFLLTSNLYWLIFKSRGLWGMESNVLGFIIRATYDVRPSPTNLNLWRTTTMPSARCQHHSGTSWWDARPAWVRADTSDGTTKF